MRKLKHVLVRVDYATRGGPLLALCGPMDNPDAAYHRAIFEPLHQTYHVTLPAGTYCWDIPPGWEIKDWGFVIKSGRAIIPEELAERAPGEHPAGLVHFTLTVHRRRSHRRRKSCGCLC